MRFSFCENNTEMGALSVSHLWGKVYALSRHPSSEKPLPLEKWLELYGQSVFYARSKGAAQLLHRLVETAGHEQISAELPRLAFKSNGRRIEFRRPLAELPGEVGTPLAWRSAAELGWGPAEVAALLARVSEGDPGHDPAEKPLDFIQDWLADPVLTAGLECIGIGHSREAPAALVAAQINPKTGWSRLSYMGLAPEFRGRGLGPWVHRHGFEMLRAQGGVLYHGGTSAENKPMLALFERHGCQLHLKMEEWVYTAGENP